MPKGSSTATEFLKRFGHRGSQEMELAQPRWAEEPWTLGNLVSRQRPDPLRPQRQSRALAIAGDADFRTAAWERIADGSEARRASRRLLETELRSAHTYLGLRETGKHYLMRGYALIRRILVELDRRFKLEGGIFFLTPEELPRLARRRGPVGADRGTSSAAASWR